MQADFRVAFITEVWYDPVGDYYTRTNVFIPAPFLDYSSVIEPIQTRQENFACGVMKRCGERITQYGDSCESKLGALESVTGEDVYFDGTSKGAVFFMVSLLTRITTPPTLPLIPTPDPQKASNVRNLRWYQCQTVFRG